MDNHEALYYLNQMEVISSNGGEETYAIVENNEENRELLEKAGIPLYKALRYSSHLDHKDFCIFATAHEAGIANYWTGEHMMYLDELDQLDALTKENKQLKETIQQAFFEATHEDTAYAIYRVQAILEPILKTKQQA